MASVPARSIVLAAPAVVNGALRSDVNTNGERRFTPSPPDDALCHN